MVPVTPTREALGVSPRAVVRPTESRAGEWPCVTPRRLKDDSADAQERGLMSPPKWYDRSFTMLDDEYAYLCVVRARTG